VHRDVVWMPIEAVGVEGDDDLWLQPADGAEDVRLEPEAVDPGQHAVLVLEQYDVADAENPSGIPQLARTNVRKPLVLLPGTVLAMREAEQRDSDSVGGAAGEQATTSQ